MMALSVQQMVEPQDTVNYINFDISVLHQTTSSTTRLAPDNQTSTFMVISLHASRHKGASRFRLRRDGHIA
eukprot:1157319-Pelagomonas_calceolata.AAC.14